MRRGYLIVLTIVTAAIAWPFVQIGIIVGEVKLFARGRPYCIEISSNEFPWYRQLGSLFELNGWSLHAPYVNTGGSGSSGLERLTFHALLVIELDTGIEWRNWSYWHQHFDKLTPKQLKATNVYKPKCKMDIEFMESVPFFRQ